MPSSDSVVFGRPLRQAVLAGRPSRDCVGEGGSGSGREGASEEPSEDLRRRHREEVEKVRAEAYARGRKEGLAEAEAAHQQELEVLRTRVDVVINGVSEQGTALFRQLEGLLPDLIIEGVGRVLHAWEPEPAMVDRIVQELVAGFDPANARMRLTLNPQDLKALQGNDDSLSHRYPGIEVASNEELARGECYLEGRFGVADARYAAKLRNLREVME